MYQTLKSDDNYGIARLVIFHFISTLIKNLSREFFKALESPIFPNHGYYRFII